MLGEIPSIEESHLEMDDFWGNPIEIDDICGDCTMDCTIPAAAVSELLQLLQAPRIGFIQGDLEEHPRHPGIPEPAAAGNIEKVMENGHLKHNF